MQWSVRAFAGARNWCRNEELGIAVDPVAILRDRGGGQPQNKASLNFRPDGRVSSQCH
jgi:hypothetical protein